jgi:hypothetical protein
MTISLTRFRAPCRRPIVEKLRCDPATITGSPYRIRVPLLTRKERLYPDTAMSCRKGWRPKEFEMKPEDLLVYTQMHPYFPAYIEGLL